MVSKELWGFLVLTLSYVSIFTLILGFFPPSLGLSFNYFIPKYRALKQNRKLKSFVKKSLLIRVIVGIIIILMSLFLYYSLTELFRINLNGYIHLFLILCPLILILDLYKTLNNVLRALNLFKVVFYLLLLQQFIYIGGLIVYFSFISLQTIELIAIINLLAYSVPLVVSIFNIIRIFKYKIKDTSEKKDSIKFVLKELVSYGSHLSIWSFLQGIFNQLRTQFIGIFEGEVAVLGFNISNNYNSVSFEAVASMSQPLTISFSELNIKESKDQIIKIYNISLHYSIYIILLISGALFFISDFFLVFVYGASYLEFSALLKWMILAIIFNVQATFFFSLLRASDKIKYILPINILTFGIKFFIFIIGLIVFDILGAIILGIFISNIIVFFIFLILNYVIFEIKMHYKKYLLQYLSFFIALIIVYLLDILILRDLRLLLSNSLKISIVEYLQIFSILIYLFLYSILNILFKVFSKMDINYLERLFSKNNYSHQLIRRGLSFIGKFFRE
ncbi:MAG: hypothetical protein GF316_19810 [Candidatus Lokiarchaeota archaeon]|nr:hypothetical protein [Candidatus Lokiarchaeota archaeon]